MVCFLMVLVMIGLNVLSLICSVMLVVLMLDVVSCVKSLDVKWRFVVGVVMVIWWVWLV